MTPTEVDSMNRLRVQAEQTNRELRAALRWLLWHHQSASSIFGLACRRALGMGQFDRLTDAQIADAKEWEAEWEAAATTKQEEGGAGGEPLNGIAATDFHGEGAIARCSYCGRYSLDRRTLGEDRYQPVCECGEKHGWSGSFRRPGPDAKWSGTQPASNPSGDGSQP